MSSAWPALDIRLLADDLTGALDSAAAFAGSVPVYLDEAPAESGGGVVAVATPTRDVDPQSLPGRLAAVQAWFFGGRLAFKKVDSLLRGNTYAECAHLARCGGFDGVVFAPAYPAQRRVTIGARQYLQPAEGTAATASTAVAADPAGKPGAAESRARPLETGPGQDQGIAEAVGGSIADAFATHGLTAWSSASDLPPGPHRGPGAGPECAGSPPVWIPDVRSDADLRRLASLAHPESSPLQGRWLWCGSAGLAHALARAAGVAAPAQPSLEEAAAHRRAALSRIAARARGEEPVTRAPSTSVSAGPTGPVLMLGASHHAVVRRQWARLRALWPAAQSVVQGNELQFEAACRAMSRPYTVAALELAPLAPLTPEQAAALLQRQLAALVAHVVAPATLLVVGGDTLLAVCHATGARLLRTLPALRPGWGRARLEGGRWDGVVCHSRSGAFGDEDDLDAMLRRALQEDDAVTAADAARR